MKKPKIDEDMGKWIIEQFNEGQGVGRIAQALGLSRTTIYEYLQSKDDLISIKPLICPCLSKRQ